jgi:hypothetical protein
MSNKNLHHDLLSTIPFLDDSKYIPTNYDKTSKTLNQIVNEEENNNTILKIKTGGKNWFILIILFSIFLLCFIIITICLILILQEIQLIRQRPIRNF